MKLLYALSAAGIMAGLSFGVLHAVSDSHGVGLIVVLMMFGALIPIFVWLYSKLHAGERLGGLHLQALAVLLAWLAALVGFAGGRVGVAAGMVVIAFVAGITGHFVHTLGRQAKDQQ